MTLNNLKWLLGLGLVFILIFATNMIDRQNFLRISKSIASLYEDRLVAKGLVYDMNEVMTHKKVALAGDDLDYFEGSHRRHAAELQELVGAFADTNLTADEASTFEQLRGNLADLARVESEVAAAPEALVRDEPVEQDLRDVLAAIDVNLMDLSKIQLDEGRHQFALATQTMNSIEMLTRLEIFFLVVIAVAAQFVILYSPGTTTDTSA